MESPLPLGTYVEMQWGTLEEGNHPIGRIVAKYPPGTDRMYADDDVWVYTVELDPLTHWTGPEWEDDHRMFVVRLSNWFYETIRETALSDP